MVRASLVLIGVVVALLWGGSQSVYVWATNRQPTKMTCAEYLAQRPGAKWLELSECEVDYLGAMQITSRALKVDKGTYVPVRPAGETGRAHLLIKAETAAVDRKMAALIQGEPKQLREPTTVKGMLVFGIDSDSKTRRALLEDASVAADFVVLDPAKEPSAEDALLGFACIGGGVALGAWWIRRLLRRGAPGQLPPPIPTEPPPLPIQG